MRINVKFDEQRATKKFKERIEELKRSPDWKKEAADLAIRKIVGDTRMGNYIKDGSKQKALLQSTISRREELAKHNDTGPSFRPGKSNLTFTGQLLKALQRTEHPTQVIIEPNDERTPYKNANGKSSKSNPTNKEILKYLSSKGRKFLGYDDKLAKQIKKLLKEHIRRFLV